MAFRSRHRATPAPTVNLVPMLDVLMSVLTFFIVMAMTLTGSRLDRIALPGAGGGEGAIALPHNTPQLVIGLTAAQEIVIQGEVVDEAELATVMGAFLAAEPEGIVILNADRSLDYAEITELLTLMGNVGGDRVSLALQN
ncbi:ExbD/TolR family protein [Spirulina major]|uniref:ExbD/TolR family protein n=1 Tax=Spirulina major TaxID=270636 RepID=UPI000932A6ED|nr:biopolymer transporter ExbD [Spirulina major]